MKLTDFLISRQYGLSRNISILTELSTEELIKKKRTTGIMTGFLAAVLIILFGQPIHAWAIEGYPSAIAIPIALSPIVFVNLKKIKEIKRELEMREESKRNAVH